MFCGICSVTIVEGSEAFTLMTKNFKQTGMIQCPCCSAKPRGYFDLEKEQIEFYLRQLQKAQKDYSFTFNPGRTLEELKDEYFRLRKINKIVNAKVSEWKKRLKPIAAPPKRTKKTKAMIATKLYKLTMYPIQRPQEISIFPQSQ
jgi:hypothetical protein